MAVLNVVRLKHQVWTRASVDIAGYNTKRIVTDEHQKKPYTKSGKKITA